MALPTAPSRSMPQSTFDAATEAFIGALPTFETDMNALATAMTLNSTTDTSVTSNTIGLGTKTFTVSTGKSFVAGMWLSIADTAAPSTNSMVCQVTSYVSGTGVLIVNSTSIYGSGTFTAWTVSQSALVPVVETGKATRTAPTISAGVLTLNLATASVFDVALNAAITTLTISNPATSGTSHKFTLTFTSDGTARAITWPASVVWPYTLAPEIVDTNGTTTRLDFHTTDGGATWHGAEIGISASHVQDGTFTWCGTAGGTANAITLTPSPAVTVYKAGRVFRFKSGASTNTGAVTAQISGIATPRAIQKNGTALLKGDIPANSYVELFDDGTTLQLRYETSMHFASTTFDLSSASATNFTLTTDFEITNCLIFGSLIGTTGGVPFFIAAFNNAPNAISIMQCTAGAIGTSGAGAFFSAQTAVGARQDFSLSTVTPTSVLFTNTKTGAPTGTIAIQAVYWR